MRANNPGNKFKSSIDTSFLISFVILGFLISQTHGAVGSSGLCKYTTGDIVGIIVGSVAVTLAVVGISLASLWYLWKKNKLKLAFLLQKKAVGKKEEKKEIQKGSDVESGHEYAFDNPYFKDDDNEVSTNGKFKLPINKSTEDNLTVIANKGTHMKDQKLPADEAPYKLRNGYGNDSNDKRRLIKSLPLSSVLNHVCKQKQPGGQKGMALDDTCIKSQPEQVSVELTGHDFTGLGFNICGNMRDGIFVKDVMTRGPANESGKVKAGDKIVGLTISFSQMVYEDALTILSYASPYKVELTLQKNSAKESVPSNVGVCRKACHTNGLQGSSNRLLHPLYRSQSVEDLSQIGKGSSLSEKSSCSGGNSVSMIQKIKSQILNKTTKSTSSDKDKSTSPTERKAPSALIASSPRLEKSGFIKESTPTLDVSPRKTPEGDSHSSRGESRASTVQADSPVKEQCETVINIVEDEIRVEAPKALSEEELLSSRPQPAPRTPGKRKGKAPLPPASVDVTDHEVDGCFEIEKSQSSPKSQLETMVQVHQAEETGLSHSDENLIENGMRDEIGNKDENEFNPSTNSSSSHVKDPEDNLLLMQSKDLGHQSPLSTNLTSRISPKEKVKSCSLGDLNRYKMSNGRITPDVLDRAVSLDLKENQLPSENLSHHYKNIRVPSNDYKDIEPIPLTKWTTKGVRTNSILTTSSSDCTDSSVKISTNCVSLEVQDNSALDFVSDTEKSVEFTTSTPMKGVVLSEITLQLNDTLEETSSDTIIKDEPLFISCDDERADARNEVTDVIEAASSKCENANKDTCNVKEDKRVIQISKSELDTMMMSHQEYINYVNKLSTRKPKPNESKGFRSSNAKSNVAATTQLDFESWSYISDNDASLMSTTSESQESSLYKTALEINQLSSNNENHIPEVSGVTFKTN